MMPRETVLSEAAPNCPECHRHLDFQVCQSAAGYYIGTWCSTCGPCSRETDYYPTREAADKAHKSGQWLDNARQ